MVVIAGEEGKETSPTPWDLTCAMCVCMSARAACSVETNWGGQRAVFTLMWERPTFPSEMDLAFMTDFINADWVLSATRLL